MTKYSPLQICDVFSSISEIVRGSVALSCLHDNRTTVPTWVVLAYLSMGLLCYQCSIFFNLILTILRTVQMSNPFYRVSCKCLNTAIIIFPLIVSILIVADAICWYFWMSTESSCIIHWWRIETVSYMGEGLVAYFLEDSFGGNIAQFMLLTVNYTLPCLLVLVCMVLQICFIKRAFLRGSRPDQGTANHANLTILLVSVLYFLTNSTYAIVYIIGYTDLVKMHGKRYRILSLVTKFTLPLINAALFPLIIILRKASLRTEMKEQLRNFLHIPLAGYLKLRGWMERRRGFVRFDEEEDEH